MIKRIIKILLIIFLILILGIFYLSVFGIKTDRFNNKIIKNISKIDKRINLDLSEIRYLLNPYRFTINVKTKNPKILIEDKILKIKDVQTNLAFKSIIKGQLSIEDLKITTNEVKINDIVLLIRKFKNSPQLLILNSVIKDGLIVANINLDFNENGKIKENYRIEGTIKKAKLNILNKYKLQNLNLNFDIEKNSYSLKHIKTKLNNIKITSPLIEIQEKKNSFFVEGQFLTDKKNFDIKELKSIFSNSSKNINFEKIEFSTNNNFSFSINKKLEFDNFRFKSTINLEEIVFYEKYLKLKPYFPNFVKKIKLKKHKIVINYDKEKFNIKGNGNILLEEKSDSLSYQIIKDQNNLSFDSKINLKNNSLKLNFLDYSKNEDVDSFVLIKGNFNKNNQFNFDLINLDDKISIKGLKLSKNFSFVDIENFNINYTNDKKILNKLSLTKNNSNFVIEGESFDASRIIDNIIDGDKKKSSIFDNLNSKINIKIKKTYLDEVNFTNNLYGVISFDKNKINNLKLESVFPNKKKINLSIETKNNSEIVTKLFSAYPKPLVKRYDFIKGFEEGYLNFYSIKKDDVSNSVLVIDNFKVKEVPIFAKLLSLASLQGMADLLTGEGIRFTDFEMNFSKNKSLTTIEEMYAIGPAVSILMDGYIESKKLVSLRGTLVPATTINRSIASIPFVGKILIGDKTGEGVFGVSFKIKGPPKYLKTTVNPIKTLTPRFITRTLEKIKKN